MGEEGFEFGIHNGYLMFSDGQKIAFTGEADFDYDMAGSLTDDKIDFSETLSNSLAFEVNTAIDTKTLFRLLVGNNNRMLRRAYRWHEKLRRMGYPKDKLVHAASNMARFGSNNGKKRPYSIKIELKAVA